MAALRSLAVDESLFIGEWDLDFCTKVVEMRPGRATVPGENRADQLGVMGQAEQAGRFLDRVKGTPADDAGLQFGLANLLMSRNQPAAAVGHMNAGVQVSPLPGTADSVLHLEHADEVYGLAYVSGGTRLARTRPQVRARGLLLLLLLFLGLDGRGRAP